MPILTNFRYKSRWPTTPAPQCLQTKSPFFFLNFKDICRARQNRTAAAPTYTSLENFFRSGYPVMLRGLMHPMHVYCFYTIACFFLTGPVDVDCHYPIARFLYIKLILPLNKVIKINHLLYSM